MGDWAYLPTDISILVVKRLVYMEDFYSLSVVCKSWKSITSMFDKMPALRPRCPLILLPEADQPCRKGVRRFHSLSDMQTYEFELPEATGRTCLGAFHGWLLTVDCDSNANLLHPFSRQQIAMPPLFAFKNQSEYSDLNLPTTLIPNCSSLVKVKLAMSRNPLDKNAREDCVVVAIVRDFPLLAFARLGDQVWTSIAPLTKVYYDVVYCEGVFYAVDGDRVLYICDVSNNKNAPIAITAPIRPRGRRQMYLVESSGDLLLVSHHRQIRGPCLSPELISQDSSPCPTTGFSVYKLAGGIGGYPCGWRKVKELGGRALFLGGNVSVSLCSSKRVKAHCIYFLEDEPEMYPGGCDTGIYNMKSMIIEPLYRASRFCVPNPPVWCI